MLDAAALKACKISRLEKVRTLGHPPSPPPGALQELEEKPWASPSPSSPGHHSSPPLQHLYNASAFKARTKARSRMRDKRADIL